MKSLKQQSIKVYFNKKDQGKTSKTGNCLNGNEVSISRPTVSIGQTTKRAYRYSDMLRVTEKSNKQKRRICQRIRQKVLRALVLL